MAKEVIHIPGEPKLPFSQAIRAGDFIFVAGQAGFRGPGNENPAEGVEAQTRVCIEEGKKVLEAAGSSLDDVVKATVYLIKAEDWPTMNEVYKQYFREDQPARASIVVGLVLPVMLVEIECIAYCPAK